MPFSLGQLTAMCRIVRAALDLREAADLACSDDPPEDADQKWDTATTELDQALDTFIKLNEESQR